MKSFEDLSLAELESRIDTAKKELTDAYFNGGSKLAIENAEREYQAILWYVAGVKRGLSEAAGLNQPIRENREF